MVHHVFFFYYPTYILYEQFRIYPGKYDAQIPLGFWDINGSPNIGQTTRPHSNQQQQQKKRTCRIVDFAVPAGHRVQLKESKKEGYEDH